MGKSKVMRRILSMVLMAALLVTSSGFTVFAEENTESGQPDTVSFATNVLTTDGEGEKTTVTDIRVRLYSADEWNENADNQMVAELLSDEDGVCRFDNLEKGSYRVEYISENPEFQPEAYKASSLPDTAEYTVTMAAEEAGEKEYFAWLGTLSVEEDTEVVLELEEISQEDSQNGQVEEGDKENSAEESETAPEDIEDQENQSVASNDNPTEETDKTQDSQTESEAEDVQTEEKDSAQEDSGNGLLETEEVPGELENGQLNEEEYSGMTISELDELDELEAGAATEVSVFSFSGLTGAGRSLVSGSDWTFDTYYVGEKEKYYAEKTSDFNLKYQMEFHTSRNLEIGAVQIRIPAVLLTDRDGEKIVPADIAVPNAMPGQPIANRVTPFNYYLDEENNELVFFNYKKIDAGTNAAWQILYKNLEVMTIVDETTWSLEPEITVNVPQDDGTSKTEAYTLEPLKGLVDTYANLASVSKIPYNLSGKSYTPGLYTESQVESYITGQLPDKYAGVNFKNYRFVVWEVKIRGNGTQPFNLKIKDTSAVEGQTAGEVVGYQNKTSIDYEVPIEIVSGTDRDYRQVVTERRDDSWGSRFYVVTAYPADKTPAIVNGTDLENTMQVILDPVDQKDGDEEQSDSASWSYSDYNWSYPPGDMIGVEKRSEDAYPGWLEAYKGAVSQGEDYGSIPYSTKGTFRGYDLTHEISNSGALGEYKEGSSYKLTTVDDFMYVYPSVGNPQMLGSKDYYFSSVSVRQTDVGYDVWEDEETLPESVKDIDQNLYIYAMFENSNTWEKVATVPWDPSGVMTYNFTADDLAKKPWRVKAEHETVNYRTVCDLDVKVRLRHDSPVMKGLMEQYEAGSLTEVRLEDISGIIGAEYQTTDGKKTFLGYCHNQSTGDGGYNYDEPGLEEATRKLYQSEKDGSGILIQRDSVFKDLEGLTKRAAAFKTSRSFNDPNHARVLVDYCVTAFDGYRIYSQDAVNYLKQAGVASPGRNNVVFYDLLPYGMRFDASQEVTAGRVKDIYTDTFKSQPKSWDMSQVTVTVDSEKDIIENYNGTGRTMVVFHVQYDGADPAVFSDETWMEGWGISFRAYYDWKDIKVAQAGTNICAFMPEDKPGHPLYQKPLCGEDTEVAFDNGIIVPEDTSGDYAPFKGGDLNEDKVTNIRNVLYAKTAALEDVALANQSRIDKLVRADSDRFGIYRESAVVEPGGGYTYDVTVSSVSDELKDIVVYDRLENAEKDRMDDPNDPMYPFENGSWYGTFQSVITSGLEERGIQPVIWYNTNRDAKISGSGEKPGDILTQENGWINASEYTGNLSDVKAVAVDLSKKADGSDFVLEKLDSVTFQIKMKAPAEKPAKTYAYNNPSFYSYAVETKTADTVEGNSVKVSVGEKENLEIVKEFKGDVPEQVRDAEFEFYLYQEEGLEQIPFANQEYQLWKKVEGKWVQQSDRLYSTDSGGCLRLHADEKAVFSDLPDAERIRVEEAENPFWEVEAKDETAADEGGTTRTVTMYNTYRPVLYAQKFLQAVPEGVDTSDDVFTFQISVKNTEEEETYTPLSNTDFWYVDSVRTDGGIPQKLGEGTTDENGQFQIREGEIIALFPGTAGVSYELKEISGAGGESDWICRRDTMIGEVPVLGGSASITNIYKWKDLYLTKSLTHQDPEDCTQKFTFQIKRVEEDGTEAAVTGNKWAVLKPDGTESTDPGECGELDENGKFSCACAGKIVKIKGLEAGKTYTVTEVDSGELYRPVNGTVEVTMPIYSSSQNAEITNDYLKRPLSVTKIVAYDPKDPGAVEDIKNKEFTMTVEVDGKPLADYPYTLIENGSPTGEFKTDGQGQFKLKNGQTAVFEDVGVEGTKFKVTETPDDKYHQIFPADNKPHEGELEAEGSSVTFINGTPGGLLLSKEYEGADEAGKEYVELMKNPYSEEGKALRKDASVKLTLEVTDQNGETYVWPKEGCQVTMVDQINGGISTVNWYSGDSVFVQPWQTLSLSKTQLGDAVSYKLTESAEDQHRVFEWRDGLWMEISQKDPADDQGVTGNIEEKPEAKIINLATSVPDEGSEIEKRMTVGSENVPEGAALVWRLERYDGSSWNPAEGVDYLTFDDAGITCDRTMTTGADGKIVLTKTANGYPKVKFTKDTVYLNKYNTAKEGELRLVELPGESDEIWGLLAGYGSKTDQYDYDMGLDSSEAIAFVNSNRNEPVEIEKKMENPSDAEFTMVLEQVLSTSAEQVNTPEDIRETRPGAAIEYTVHSSDNDMQLGTGITGKNGEINLKAGQYARLELPDGTLWTVREEQKPDHVLKELTGTPDEKVKLLADNLMLIQQRAEVVGILDIQVKNPYIGMNEVITKDNFIVTAAFSDGSTKLLTTEDYTLTPEAAAGIPGPMEVVIQWTEGKLEGTAVLTVAEEIEITQEMVKNGVIDGVTGEQVILNKGAVTIPESIIWKEKPYTVVGIDTYAFHYNKEITAIKFPETLKRIGYMAFAECTNLKGELKLPDGVTQIEDSAFADCSGFTGDLVIPESAKEFGVGVFRNCSGFDGELILPKSWEEIKSGTFAGCSGFKKKLSIPENITVIKQSAFAGCSGFTGLSLPEQLTEIGDSAFADCSGFTGDLLIPGNVISIGSSAFAGCSGFAGNLVIPDSVISVGSSAFEGCSGFNGTLKISEGLTSIEESTFENCSGLTGALVIPESIEVIGTAAFRYCQFDGELKLPENLTVIQNSAFESCNKFNGNLSIPGTVTKIGSSAFKSASFNGELRLAEGIKTIEKSAFEECKGLTGGLTIPDSVTILGESAFYQCDINGTLTISENLTEIARSTFNGCSNLTGNLNIPDSVEVINSYAFNNCSGFTGELVIPTNITEINEAVFKGCKGFSGDLYIPGYVTKIGARAFQECSGLKGNLIISEGVNSIGLEAFRESGFDGTVQIPNSMNSIGYRAFYLCSPAEIIVDNVKDAIPGAPWACSSVTAEEVVWLRPTP